MDFEKELRQALDGSDALIGDSYINAISDLFIKLIEEQPTVIGNKVSYSGESVIITNVECIDRVALINAIKGQG